MGREKRGVYKGVENRGKEPVNEERRLLCDSLLFSFNFEPQNIVRILFQSRTIKTVLLAPC